ncbi:hypothetical protein EG831_05385 [bacterium]|nr:hypothetical protein [bacterium]
MSRPPMHPLLKILIVAVLLMAGYIGFKFLIAYIRFADIKGKMQEAVVNSYADTDNTIADKLAENALDDKLPIAGDYFYQVRDNAGKVFVLEPETDEQKAEYKRLATDYFLSTIKRGGSGREFSIAIAYDQEIYFPFNLYKHVLKFSHEEALQQPK